MGLFVAAENSIHLKVVYYGPAFGGKTTNLRAVCAMLDRSGERGVLSLNTDDDTTLFFDYLPLSFRILNRYVVRVQGYTVPGQVKFDNTRRLVLKGADGVVFVADSTPDRLFDSVTSLQNLHDNLGLLGLAGLPVVLQYNKRDVTGATSIDHLEQTLNLAGMPSNPAVAIRGEGIAESFRALLRLVFAKVHAEYSLERHGLALDAGLAALDAALAVDEPRAPGEERRVVIPGHALSTYATDGDLLTGAVSAGLELSELATSLLESNQQLAARTAAMLEAGQRAVHDLRKPVCALKNVVHLLKTGQGDLLRAKALSMASEIIGEMERQLTDCAGRFEEQEASTREEDVDLEELVNAALRRLSYFAQDKGVELSCSGTFPKVRAPRSALVSILTNLVGNAIKYSDPAKGKRRVAVIGRRTRGGLLLAVQDNGIGIGAGDRPRVFEKYHRAGGVADIGGTGLGLHLVAELARSFGGRAGLRSRPKRGSLFYVRLPCESPVEADRARV